MEGTHHLTHTRTNATPLILGAIGCAAAVAMAVQQGGSLEARIPTGDGAPAGSDVLVGAWFYDGYSSVDPTISDACEEKADHWRWVEGATRREVDYVYAPEDAPVAATTGYVPTGVVAYLPANGDGRAPLYRLRLDGHRYTTSDAERDAWVAEGATLEGIIGYVFREKQPGTTKLYRPIHYGVVHEVTFDPQRPWLFSGNDPSVMASWVLGYAYQTERPGTMPVREYVKYLPGQLQPREPLLGHVAIDDQAVMDQYIAWASSRDIDFFTFEWWAQPNRECGRTNMKYKALEHAFMTSADASDMQFNVGWFSHVYETDDDITYDYASGALTYIAETYFPHPSYLRIGNKPVLYWGAGRYIRQLGPAAVQQLIGHVNDLARAQGFDGVYLVLISDARPNSALRYADLGFSGYTSFVYVERIPGFHQTTSIAEAPATMSYREYMRAHPPLWTQYAADLAATDPTVNYIPVLGVGFDKTVVPWLKYRSQIATHIDLAEWQWGLTKLRNFVLTNPTSDPKIVMLTAWNEWTEGQILEPSVEFGTSFIDTVRSVF